MLDFFDFILKNSKKFEPVNNQSKNGLQLNPITVNPDYCKQWNVSCNDFFVMAKDGEILNHNLYRVGGMGQPNLNSYFLILKYVEDYYPDSITRDKKTKPHLDGRWCIYDKHGVEKKEFKSTLDYPYHIKDSCIYSLKSTYYNIETGECYGYSSTHMESTDFLFIEIKYDDKLSKRGVLKINKHDGTFELIK